MEMVYNDQKVGLWAADVYLDTLLKKKIKWGGRPWPAALPIGRWW